MDHSSLLKPSWNTFMKQMKSEDLAVLLLPGNFQKSIKNMVWPLGMLCFKMCCDCYSIRRTPVPSIKEHLMEALSVHGGCLHQDSGQDTTGAVKDGQYLILDHCYRKHVKPKKQHEITNLGEVLSTLADMSGCDHIVDVGAGQGHLSRLLAFGYGLEVTTMEAADCHAPKAEKYDKEVKTDIEKGRIVSKKKRKNGIHVDMQAFLSETEPLHVTAVIDPSISVNNFLTEIMKAKCEKEKWAAKDMSRTTGHCDKSVVSSSEKTICHQNGSIKLTVTDTVRNAYQFTDNTFCSLENGQNVIDFKQRTVDLKNSSHKNLVKTNHEKSEPHTKVKCYNESQRNAEKTAVKQQSIPDFILTGLHACGDLSTTMMKVFSQCPLSKAVASVACCYMKLSTDSDSENKGYPMSEYVHNLNNHFMSYEARELACHFVDTYCQRLRDNSPHLKSHVYRCALQEIILEKNSNIQHGSIRLSLKNVSQLKFEEYAAKALPKLGLDSGLTKAQLERAERRLNCWKDVVAFYTIRLCLAPVIETVILLDRMLYLAELEISSCLLPIFDPVLSPRNFALVAIK